MKSPCPNCNCMTTNIRVNNTKEKTIICGKCKKRKYEKKINPLGYFWSEHIKHNYKIVFRPAIFMEAMKIAIKEAREE